jgi:uncharacterized tellurite resistance protein B-like protein
MNVIQAGFDLLALLSAIDQRPDASEFDVIGEFLTANHDGQFDAEEELDMLCSLDETGMEERFDQAADFFKSKTSEQERHALLDFALRVIFADGKVDERETRFFKNLGNRWGIDVQKIVNARSD